MDKITRIEKYLFDFFSNRFEHLEVVYKSTRRDRHSGIYLLKEGPKLMDFLIAIHGLVEEKFYAQNLIPHRFATPDSLLRALEKFKQYLNANQLYLDINDEGENTSFLVTGIQAIKDELIQAIDYTKRIFDYEDTLIPYQELRYNLIINNIPAFIQILESILASVSYAISKTQEGFFHSNVHLIIKLLGFDILSEELSNTGRIDAVIRFSDKIYLVEFKFNEEADLSQEALQQIKAKQYALKFIVERKETIGIGISFSRATRNINGYKFEQLN